MKILRSFLFISIFISLSSCFTDVSRENPDDPKSSRFTSSSIAVTRGVQDILNGSACSMGSTEVGSDLDVVFTIKSTGELDLLLNGSPLVETSGARFSVLDQPGETTLSPGSSTTFTLRFSPDSSGEASGTVTVYSNDPLAQPFRFTVTGTGTLVSEPEINVLQGTTAIADGGSFDFGNVDLGGNKDIIFTIENQGSVALELTGSPLVTFVGGDTGMFSVTDMPDSTISAGESDTFTVRFTPGSEGLKQTTLVISSNDADEGTYNFALNGTGTLVPEPEMHVRAGIDDIPVGDSISFSSITVGSTDDITFTIENNGTSDLTLDGSPVVYISGTDAGMFSVTDDPSTTIAASGSDTFTIRFSPTSTGVKSASVSIDNNDGDEDPYTFNISGESTAATAPEINVKDPASQNLLNGGSYSFGNCHVGTGTGRTFTIENLGTAALYLTGSPRVDISGDDAAMFVVSTQPSSPILVGQSRSVTITFTPTGRGLKSATVTIASDDADENPYTFDISGSGIDPEIGVSEGGTPIEISDDHSLGDVGINNNQDFTFTITNTGNEPLVLSGSPLVSIGGTNESMFTVTSQPASSVPASGSTTFTLRFTPTSIGWKHATVSIPNNDSDEGSYSFSLKGNGLYHGIKSVDTSGTTGKYTNIGTYFSGSINYVYIVSINSTDNVCRSSRSTDGGSSFSTWSFGSDADQVSMTMYGSTMYASYYDESDDDLWGASSSSGSSWSGPFSALDAAGDVGKYSDIACDGSYVYVSYYDQTNYDLKFMKCSTSWTGISRTSVDTGGDCGYLGTSIGVSGSTVLISYYYSTSGDLRVARSTNSGSSFSTASVDTSNDTGRWSDLYMDGSTVHLCYLDYTGQDLEYRRSTDGGASWTLARTIDSTVGSIWNHFCSIAADGDSVYVAYYDSTGKDLMLAYSDDCGSTWSSSTVESANDVGQYPSIAVEFGGYRGIYDIVSISYYDNTNYDLRFARSLTGGASW